MDVDGFNTISFIVDDDTGKYITRVRVGKWGTLEKEPHVVNLNRVHRLAGFRFMKRNGFLTTLAVVTRKLWETEDQAPAN